MFIKINVFIPHWLIALIATFVISFFGFCTL